MDSLQGIIAQGCEFLSVQPGHTMTYSANEVGQMLRKQQFIGQPWSLTISPLPSHGERYTSTDCNTAGYGIDLLGDIMTAEHALLRDWSE